MSLSLVSHLLIGILLTITRYVWESKADGAFAISEDTWNDPLGRGTEIRLHLRDEAGEYLEESKLKVRARHDVLLSNYLVIVLTVFLPLGVVTVCNCFSELFCIYG